MLAHPLSPCYTVLPRNQLALCNACATFVSMSQCLAQKREQTLKERNQVPSTLLCRHFPDDVLLNKQYLDVTSMSGPAHLQAGLDGCLADGLGRLEDVGGVHEAREGVEGVVDAQVGRLQVRLDIGFIHRVHCVRDLHASQ